MRNAMIFGERVIRRSMEKVVYKVAVIGCGRIASTFDDDPKRKYITTHIGAYKHIKGTTINAVCDLDRIKLRQCMEKWGIQRGYIDYKEMLEKEEIDVLSICTPPDTHYPIVRNALENKHIKAIFCEKPISDNVKNAKDMVQLCRRKKIILQIGHQRRFDHLHIEIREFIRSKKFCEVQQVNFYYTAGINNTGSHMFDILRFFFGNVEWMEAFLSKNKSHKEEDPNLDGIIKFKNGTLATFQACDVKNYLIFELDCFLDKGRLILKDSGFAVDFYRTRESKYYSGYKELQKTETPFDTRYKKNFMVNSVRHLIACVKDGKESISSGIDGLRALEMIEASIKSARQNGKRMYLN